MSEVLVVDPGHVAPALLTRAAAVLRQGGLVGFPTRHAYGIGADPRNPDALAAIYRVKGRPASNPILVLVDDAARLATLAREVSRPARRLMERFWPGGLTLVLPVAAGWPQALTAGSGKIGVRLAGHPVARALAAQAGGALTGTSANLAGQAAIRDPRDFAHLHPPGIDLVLDVGLLPHGPPSTVVDATGTQPVLLREGAVDWAEVQAAWHA